MYDRPAKILNVASTAGITSRPGWLAYASSKAAVVSMSATLADELAGSGIKVYSISPGRTATELRRKLAPEEDPSHDHAAGRRRRRHRPADERRREDPRRAEHRRPHPGLAAGEPARIPARERAPACRPALLLAPAGPVPSGSCWRRPASRRSTATCSTSIGRCVARHPELDYVLLLEPYSYGLARQARLPGPAGARDVPPPDGAAVRGRQRLPADPRRPAPAATTVVQVWHAAGALKRFGARHRDAARPSRNGPSSTATTTRSWSAGSGRGRRMRRPSGPRSSACSRSARHGPTSSSTRRPWPRRGRASSPPTRSCAGRRVVLYAPTFRGRGVGEAGGARAGRRRDCGRPCRRTMPWSSRPTRTSTRRRPRRPATTSSSTRPATSTTCWRWPTS